jgi:hypothetical protein
MGQLPKSSLQKNPELLSAKESQVWYHAGVNMMVKVTLFIIDCEFLKIAFNFKNILFFPQPRFFN